MDFQIPNLPPRWRNAPRLALVGSIAWFSAALAWAEPLPFIGAAPNFLLTTQEDRPLTLHDLRGKVVALTFIFTQCSSTCPVLTAKLVDVQRKLTVAADRDVRFVAISLTPEHDSPQDLKRYAQAHGADLARWSLLTGDGPQIRRLAKRFGVWVKRSEQPTEVDHGFVTSLIDRRGTIRVQYIGTRFATDELLADLRHLTGEAASR